MDSQLEKLISTINCFYATDAKKFYDKKLGKPLTDSELETVALIAGAEVSQIAQIKAKLIGSGVPYNLGRSLSKLKGPQLLKARLDIAYNELKEFLPFVFVKKAEGSAFPFKRLNPNEVFTVKSPNNEALANSLQSDSAVYATFLKYYESSDVIRNDLGVQEFLEELLDRAKADPDNFSPVEPKFITWKEGELAFKYFNPEVLVDAPTPYYDSFCKRLDFPEVFMAWVWSVFEPNNTGRQIMWIQGKGHDGKSTLFTALNDFIGKHHSSSISTSEFESDFFFNNVYGRILLTYPDCGVTNIFDNEKLKNITGGDEQIINGKFAQTFKASVYSKVLIGSNQIPQVSWHLDYQKSRIIVLRIAPMNDGKSHAGDSKAIVELKKETPAFLKKCRELYSKYYKTGSSLQVPLELERKMNTHYISNEVSVIKKFCRDRIIFGENYKVTKMELQSEISFAFKGSGIQKSKDFNMVCEEYIKTLNKGQVMGPMAIDFNGEEEIGFTGLKLKDPEPIGVKK